MALACGNAAPPAEIIFSDIIRGKNHMIKFKPFGTLVFMSMLSLAQPRAFGGEGRQSTAPPWSAACMTDHGPSDCGEPMWIYSAAEQHARKAQSSFEISISQPGGKR
jgi:hypothetical protein